MTRTILLVAIATIALGGCNLIPTDAGDIQINGMDTVCVLVSASSDSYASYGYNGGEQDRNFGRSGQLVVARGPLGDKHTYIDVKLPKFPAETRVLKAKLELFHSGKNEDGTSDDIVLHVGAIRNETWSPGTLTWRNRPDRGGNPPVESTIYLRSQAWSGSQDIAGFVDEMIRTPDGLHGFLVSLPVPRDGRQVEKGFYSNNEVQRREGGRVVAPRLLMKVAIPRGTASTLLMPADQLEPGSIREVLTASGRNGWPAEWNVSPDH